MWNHTIDLSMTDGMHTLKKDFCNVYCKEAARRQTKYTSIITYVCACFARFYLRWLLLSKNHTCTVVLHYFSSTSPFAQSSRRWNCFVYTLCPLTSQDFLWVYIRYWLQRPSNLALFCEYFDHIFSQINSWYSELSIIL